MNSKNLGQWEVKRVDLTNESTDSLHPITVDQARKGVANDLTRRLGDGWECFSTEVYPSGELKKEFSRAVFVFRRRCVSESF